MKQVVAKLAFVHRRLWQRDKTYRAALLLGPPPLFGCALAVALWVGVHAAGELPRGRKPAASLGAPPRARNAGRSRRRIRGRAGTAPAADRDRRDAQRI